MFLIKTGVFCTHSIPVPPQGVKADRKQKGNTLIKCSFHLLHSFSAWARWGLRQVAVVRDPIPVGCKDRSEGWDHEWEQRGHFGPSDNLRPYICRGHSKPSELWLKHRSVCVRKWILFKREFETGCRNGFGTGQVKLLLKSSPYPLIRRWRSWAKYWINCPDMFAVSLSPKPKEYEAKFQLTVLHSSLEPEIRF